MLSYVSDLCTSSNERLDLLELTIVSSLEPWGIVKDEVRVAGEAERAMDVMDSALKKICVTGRGIDP